MLAALSRPLTPRSVPVATLSSVSETTRDALVAAVAEAAATLAATLAAAVARLRHWAWTAWELVGAMYLSMRYFTGEPPA